MFTASKSALAQALALSGDIVERRNTIPILSNVLIDRAPAGLCARMTDLDIEATVAFEADVDLDFAPVTVPAHLLRDIVRKLGDGTNVTVKPTGDQRDGISLRSGRSRFSLATLPEADFPTLETGEPALTFEVDAPALAAALAGVRFAISTEETRYYLNGIYLHPSEGGLMLVATDGHRLAKRFLPAATAPQDWKGVIVPRKAAAILDKILPKTGSLRVGLTESKITIEAGGVRLASKLIDGTFPDYRRVIPRGGDTRVEVESAPLKTGVERVMTVAGERGNAVKLAFEAGQLTLSTRNPDAGDAEDTLDHAGPADVALGLNGKYLLEALSHLPDGTLTLEITDPGSPVILRADGDHAENIIVIMPMRV